MEENIEKNIIIDNGPGFLNEEKPTIVFQNLIVMIR